MALGRRVYGFGKFLLVVGALVATFATSRAIAGVLVLESTTMVPGAQAAMTPPSPSITARVATSSATMEITNSAPFTAPAAERHTVMPLSAKGFALAGSRFQTRRLCPAACRCATRFCLPATRSLSTVTVF